MKKNRLRKKVDRFTSDLITFLASVVILGLLLVVLYLMYRWSQTILPHPH